MNKAILSLLLLSSILFAERLKDISNIVGVRENQLIGYGLVVGLNGTGDGTSSQFTTQSLANMLQSVNVKVDPGAIKSKNVAAVMVTADLPPFGRQGDKMDILISSIGDAKSIEGGTLLMTPLKGMDGEIYAIAQGAVSIGGKSGRGGAQNHPLAGTIPDGGVIEREVSYDLSSKKSATLSLKTSNFSNALEVQSTINKFYGDGVAQAIDPRTIKLERPENMSMVEFLAGIEDLQINYSKDSKIVIDERTGTVVAGVDIKIDPVVVTHGEITIKIDTAKENNALKEGDVDMGDGVSIGVNSNTLTTAQEMPTVANVTRALQKLGATPKVIISILEAMKKAGAISVDLEII